MTKQDFLFTLLRSELWNKHAKKPVELPDTAYRSLVDMAEMQTVTGMLCNALAESNVKLGKLNAIDTFVRLRDIEKRNKELDNGVANFARLMNDHHIQYFVVKGQTVSTLYPHPHVRIPGDIDVFIRQSDMQRALQLISQTWNVEVPEFSGKHIAIAYCDTELEVHQRLQGFNSSKHQTYWDEVYDKAFDMPSHMTIGGETVQVLEPTLMVLHIFVHFYAHLLVLGVGLRQLVDLTVCLNAYRQEIDWHLLEKHLRSLGMYHAFCAMGYVMMHRLGLPKDCFQFRIEHWHERYEQRILDDMFYRGNFGKYNRKVQTVNWKHTLETAWIVVLHCLKFFRLSPCEIALQLPRMVRCTFVRQR